jgi:hypothetical protein
MCRNSKYFYFVIVLLIDTMEKAKESARKAEVTSNLDSDDNSPGRIRKRPHSKASLEEFPDSSDSTCKLIML